MTEHFTDPRAAIQDLRKRGIRFIYDGTRVPLMVIDHPGGGCTVAFADMNHPRWARP